VANFQTHITIAAGASIAATAVCVQSGIVSHADGALLLALGTLAGILPDIDSDHSVPTRILFNILGFAAALAVIFLLRHQPLIYLLGAAMLTALTIRIVVYPIFASITEHRGLFHSLPAALLIGLATVSTGIHLLGWSLHFAWLAGCFVSGGYLVHLLLDEIYSVNFMGSQLKKSFGSALTLFSGASWASYLLLYLIVGAGFLLLPMPARL